MCSLAAQQSDPPKPTCHNCPATYIPKSEMDAYAAKAMKYHLIDQQVRSVDIGKAQVGVGMQEQATCSQRYPIMCL
jgi:hypothetical protein